MSIYLKFRIFVVVSIAQFIIFSSVGFAQADYQTKQAMDLYRSNKMVTGDWRRDLSLEDIAGTPYLNDDFITGKVYSKQKQIYVDVQLRYNIYSDVIEFKGADGSVFNLATPEDVERVEFGEYVFKFCQYQNGKAVSKGFFQVLVEGKASLLVKQKTVFKDAVPAAAYKEPEPPKFVRISDLYFIGVGNEPIREVTNKKDLIAIFPDNNDKIDDFISKNKTKHNKPDGLTELVKYYNSL